MHAINATIVLAIAAGLAGCGKTPAPAASGNPAPLVATARPATTGNASAEEVASQARGSVSCPASIATPAHSASAPVDDIVGVRPGLTYEEAGNVVECSNELLVVSAETSRGFDIKSYGQKIRQGFSARFAEPRVVKTSKQIMKEMQDDAMARGMNARREDLKPGQVKWYVSTMGLPGQERVLAAAREERFVEAQSPTLASVGEALLKKYGTPTREQGPQGQAKSMRWAYDPLGRRITETSPLYARCVGAASPDAGLHLSRDCGVIVEAMLIPQRANPDLVDRMQVGVVDQAGGDRMVAATELGLQQMDGQRRAQEVAKAGKNARAPSL
ncbi:MAG TPA: hypothetical protein VFF72_08050 [Caldimonas sp.]|nr:hypothetical protein [Caldimonas sp.]